MTNPEGPRPGSGAPPSNPQIIARRRQHVAALRLRGFTLRQIEAALAETPETRNPNTGAPWSYGVIQNDTKALEAEWGEAAGRDVAERKALVSAEIAELKKAAWQRGALVTVLRGIERECKLFGLDAPTKISPTSPDGATEYMGGKDSVEEARAKIARMMMKAVPKALTDEARVQGVGEHDLGG